MPAFHHPIPARDQRFLADNGIEIAGIEFIAGQSGELYTYDVNTNADYNAQAVSNAGLPVTGMQAVTAFPGDEPAKQQHRGETRSGETRMDTLDAAR